MRTKNLNLPDCDTYDQATDSGSNLSIYHFSINNDEEFLECEGVLIGFDYDGSDHFKFVCDEYEVVVQGLESLNYYAASMFWNSDGSLIRFPIENILYYSDYNDFLAHNPPRVVSRIEKDDLRDGGMEEE